MRVLAPDGTIDSSGIGYSQGIVDGDRIFFSGQVGWDNQFEIAGTDVRSQTEQSFENVRHLLDEAGASLSDVRKVTAYLVDAPAATETFLEVWSEVFANRPFPCLTILGVESLATESLLVEIEVEV